MRFLATVTRILSTFFYQNDFKDFQVLFKLFLTLSLQDLKTSKTGS